MFRLDKAVTDRTQKIKVQNVFMLLVGNTKDLCLGTAPELKEDLKEEGHGRGVQGGDVLSSSCPCFGRGTFWKPPQTEGPVLKARV